MTKEVNTAVLICNVDPYVGFLIRNNVVTNEENTKENVTANENTVEKVYNQVLRRRVITKKRRLKESCKILDAYYEMKPSKT